MSRDRPRPPEDWIEPSWPAPRGIRALITTRAGGCSTGVFAASAGGGMNLGLGRPHQAGEEVDDAAAVRRNRELLRACLPQMPRWLEQVHGARVVDAAREDPQSPENEAPRADAAFATHAGVVCCVLVADCLPVLLADAHGRGVAAAHAGWRGMAEGVIQNTVAALRTALGDEHARILAYLGPAIGPEHFEVGAEVLEAMLVRLPKARSAFRPAPAGKFHADLFALARQALAIARVDEVFGGGLCTASDPARFYSFRRDRVTGRHAALIWRAPEGAIPGAAPRA